MKEVDKSAEAIQEKEQEIVTVDMKTMSEIELKALAYDQIGVMENARKGVEAINQELSRRQQLNIVAKP